MGLYDAAFLNAHASDVLALKNVKNASGLRWKQRGVGWEDKLFKVCDAMSPDAPVRRFTRRCENRTLGRRTCICNGFSIARQPEPVYGPGSTPRQVWSYDCADVHERCHRSHALTDPPVLLAPAPWPMRARLSPAWWQVRKFKANYARNQTAMRNGQMIIAV